MVRMGDGLLVYKIECLNNNFATQPLIWKHSKIRAGKYIIVSILKNVHFYHKSEEKGIPPKRPSFLHKDARFWGVSQNIIRS